MIAPCGSPFSFGGVMKQSSMQIWREKNKETVKAKDAVRRSTEKHKEYIREFKQRNKECGRTKISNQKHAWTKKVKALTVVANGAEIKCVRCGIADRRVLQLHHKSGNGKRDPRLYDKSENLPIGELEIRCCNCNILAEYEELGRRFPNIIGFDDNFNPIWKETPPDRKPLTPLACDYCGVTYIPICRKPRKHHYCGSECYRKSRKREVVNEAP